MSVDDFVKIATVLSPIILAYIALLQVRAARRVAAVASRVSEVASKADDAALKVAEVAEAARGSDQIQLDIKSMAEATHKLVNSERGTTLRLLMLAYQRASARPEATELDHELYHQARIAHEDHMRGQSQADSVA